MVKFLQGTIGGAKAFDLFILKLKKNKSNVVLTILLSNDFYSLIILTLSHNTFTLFWR